MTYIPDIPEVTAKEAYGDLRTAGLTPITQVNAVYNLGDQSDRFEGSGGVVTAPEAIFECTTSDQPFSFAGVLSKRSVAYRAGQGMLARFSAIFGTPAPVNRQQAGFTSNTDALMFGYDGTTFGIVREYGGFSDIHVLTLTAGAGGSETATVVVDNLSYSVPLTAGTVEHNAFEIAEYLNSQGSLHRFGSNGATVVSVSLFAAPAGPFTYSSASSAGTWAQEHVGVTPEREHIPQAQWNVDTMPDLDPLKGNVYQIQLQWLGYGNINFFIEDPANGEYKLVHSINYPNSSITPSLSNPTLKVGWFNGNAGGTTGTTLKGSSAAGFVEGAVIYHADPRSASAEAIVNTTETAVLALRSRFDYGGRANKVETELMAISAASESSKITHVALYKGAVVTDDVVWEYVDRDESVIECAKNAGELTSGKLIALYVLPPGSNVQVDLRGVVPVLQPGETYTVGVHVSGGSASDVAVDLTWKELL